MSRLGIHFQNDFVKHGHCYRGSLSDLFVWPQDGINCRLLKLFHGASYRVGLTTDVLCIFVCQHSGIFRFACVFPSAQTLGIIEVFCHAMALRRSSTVLALVSFHFTGLIVVASLDTILKSIAVHTEEVVAGAVGP